MKPDLPPGQRAIDFFPRFGVPAYASRLPAATPEPTLVVGGPSVETLTLRAADLAALPRRELVADFHCVTTWSRRGLRWSGWSLRDLYARFLVARLPPGMAAPHLEVRALDGYSVSLLLEDALAEDVLIADQLDGQPIPLEHGAPLRLVAPAHYGYKSAKHLCELHVRDGFRAGYAERLTRAHPRGRVALEERGRGLPGWFYRWLYRASWRPALWYYRRFEGRR
jgi:DMSO/TMAO reductase YedYZ molybdopterin-dependent catalytic subunit